MLIVGAGPAGVAAAVPLAAAGRDVVVVDKAVFPRDKCCGDGLTTLALRELEHARLRPVDGRRLAGRRRRRAALAVGPGGHRPAAARARARSPPSRRGCSSTPRSSSSPSPPGPRCSRATASTARSRPHADHVVVGIDDHEPIAARYVIAADGMWSPVRKALGLAEPGLPRRVARLPPVRPRRRRPGRRAPLRVVRRRPAARVRLVVPAPRRAGQRRLRRAARRHAADPGHEGHLGRAARPPARARRARAATPSWRAGTRRGRSRPASTGPRWPRAARCSSATRRWPPT